MLHLLSFIFTNCETRIFQPKPTPLPTPFPITSQPTNNPTPLPTNPPVSHNHSCLVCCCSYSYLFAHILCSFHSLISQSLQVPDPTPKPTPQPITPSPTDQPITSQPTDPVVTVSILMIESTLIDWYPKFTCLSYLTNDYLFS